MKNYLLFLMSICLPSLGIANDTQAMKSALENYCTGISRYVLQREPIELPSQSDLNDSLEKSIGHDLINAIYSPAQESNSIAQDICENIKIESAAKIKGVLEGKKEVEDKIFEDEHWANFFSVFHGAKGLIYTSIIAYSADKKSAVVFVATGCGPLCGGSSFIVLSKNKKGWRRVKSIQFSQS